MSETSAAPAIMKRKCRRFGGKVVTDFGAFSRRVNSVLIDGFFYQAWREK
jgi:hypothetical protein